MNKFCEWEFKKWLSHEAGYDIRKHTDRTIYSKEEVEDKVEDKIDGLSPLDMTCYLGDYLTRDVE